MAATGRDLLSVTQAAETLGVSATTVRNWAADGRLPEQRTAGGHRRFRAEDVARLARELSPERRARVLVVDDDDAIRYVVREAFAAAGYEVVEAASGLLGLDALDSDPPALILLDLMMPGLDGVQVMKYMERYEVRVPVLAFSALGERVAEKVRALGADDFLAKPFDVAELVRRSQRLIDASRSG